MVRPIRTIEEYRAVEGLQRDVWGLDDVEIVPDHVLLTAQKNGGMVLGAFHVAPEGGEVERLVGFVFGFVEVACAGAVGDVGEVFGTNGTPRMEEIAHIACRRS